MTAAQLISIGSQSDWRTAPIAVREARAFPKTKTSGREGLILEEAAQLES